MEDHLLVGTGEAWGFGLPPLKFRPVAERSESKSQTSGRSSERERSGERESGKWS